MIYGKFATLTLTANTDNVVYTVPDSCYYGKISINILNTDINDAVVNVALSATATPTADEYIEKGTIIPADGGILERNGLICSPTENIVINTTKSGTIVRVSGILVTSTDKI